MIITIDIETKPGKPDWIKSDIEENLHPPGNIKKQETIDSWWQDKAPVIAEEEYHSAGLDAATGEIICIGCKIDDNETHVYTGTEYDVIEDFFCQLLSLGTRTPIAFAGHNVKSFDLPYIWRRAKVLGITIPRVFPAPLDIKPWSEDILDTMTLWAGQRDRISLDKLCKVFGIPGKDDVDGSMVWQMYQDGKIEEIAEYCKSDVDKTYEVLQRLL